MPTTVTSPQPVSPSLDDEVSFISGVTSSGTVAAVSGGTWTGEGPDSNTPDTVATYNQTDSGASKWAPGGPSAGPSTIGSEGGTQYYYFDPNSSFTAAQQKALASGLKMWSAVANIQFTEITAAPIAERGALPDSYVPPPVFDLNSREASDGLAAACCKARRDQDPGSVPLREGAGTFLTVDTGPDGFDVGNFNDGGSGVGVIP